MTREKRPFDSRFSRVVPASSGMGESDDVAPTGSETSSTASSWASSATGSSGEHAI